MDNSKQNKPDIQTIKKEVLKINKEENTKKPEIICQDKKTTLSKIRNNIQYQRGRFLVTELYTSEDETDNDV